jgi:hypothetical protein
MILYHIHCSGFRHKGVQAFGNSVVVGAISYVASLMWQFIEPAYLEVLFTEE